VISTTAKLLILIVRDVETDAEVTNGFPSVKDVCKLLAVAGIIVDRNDFAAFESVNWVVNLILALTLNVPL
jgi:hypothetical protein